MKYAKLTLPSKKLCFVMALAAGIMAFPLPTMAEQTVQNVQQSGVVKGQVTDKNGEPIIGATVTTTLFRALLLEGAPAYNLLKAIGFITKDMETMGLFANDSTAFLMVIIYSIWTCVGINMILFYGAMRRIPHEIFESADIDGAGFFRQFASLVVPLIWPTITTLIIFSLSGMFITYTTVMILCPTTKSASMIGWYIVHYTTAKNSHASLNYPAAVGLAFTAVGLPFVLFVRWLLNKISANVEYYGGGL